VQKKATRRRFPDRTQSHLIDFVQAAFPSPAERTPSDKIMPTLAPSHEASELEQLRQQELAEARAIQAAMLPHAPLKTLQVRISHQFQPFEHVGGDFLDFFLLSDGTVGLYLGDVTGKGLPAALYAALAVGTLRGVHKTGTPPDEVLTLLNKRMLLRGVCARHVAVQYALLDPKTGIMRISSAGMAGPLHISAGGCSELLVRGIPPGLFTETSYETATIELRRGDAVVFISDGLTDALSLKDEMFGMERIMEICRHSRESSPVEILEGIYSKVTRFSRGHPRRDDQTAAVLRYLG
jgi:phosphoserine phosphatase RsbU/P